MSDSTLFFISEPQLEFAFSQLEEHPKDGLYLYGPAERGEHSETLKIGMIGTRDGLSKLDDFGKLVTGHIPPYVEDRVLISTES